MGSVPATCAVSDAGKAESTAKSIRDFIAHFSFSAWRTAAPNAWAIVSMPRSFG